MGQLSDNDSVKVATTVIPNNSLALFDKTNLYTVRTSDNWVPPIEANKTLSRLALTLNASHKPPYFRHTNGRPWKQGRPFWFIRVFNNDRYSQLFALKTMWCKIQDVCSLFQFSKFGTSSVFSVSKGQPWFLTDRSHLLIHSHKKSRGKITLQKYDPIDCCLS